MAVEEEKCARGVLRVYCTVLGGWASLSRDSHRSRYTQESWKDNLLARLLLLDKQVSIFSNRTAQTPSGKYFGKFTGFLLSDIKVF